jgi:lathosterol oxidase
VHSLHHRNTDIEPFAGLCMHPIEHLYYYSCVGPSLVFKMSPFHTMWHLIHLLISPVRSSTMMTRAQRYKLCFDCARIIARN